MRAAVQGNQDSKQAQELRKHTRVENEGGSGRVRSKGEAGAVGIAVAGSAPQSFSHDSSKRPPTENTEKDKILERCVHLIFFVLMFELWT